MKITAVSYTHLTLPTLSPLGQKYLEEIRKYKAMGMDIRGVEDIKADQKQS